MFDKTRPRSGNRSPENFSRRGPQQRAQSAAANRVRQLRRAVCEESARILAEEGARDYQRAKRKACERLGVDPNIGLPRNSEIAQAVAARLRLFQADTLEIRYRRQLESVLHGMDLLQRFSPRAVGTLLDGFVTAQTPVQIHVFSPTPEEVHASLNGQGVPFELHDKRYRFGRNRHRLVSGLRFIVNEIAVEVSVFLDQYGFDPPRCPINGRAMRRASAMRIQELLAEIRQADENR